MRAIHSEMPITRLIGAKTKDKVWRNIFNSGLGKESAAEEGRAWTGNMVDSHSGRGEALTEIGFSPNPILVGESVSGVSPTLPCGTEIGWGWGEDFPRRYL